MSQAAAAIGVWNKAETLERLGDDEELLQELIGIFLAESPKILMKLQDAVARSDSDNTMRGAHSIKGEVSCLGAPLASRAAQILENIGSSKDLSAAPEAFAALQREVEALQLVLRQAASSK